MHGPSDARRVDNKVITVTQKLTQQVLVSS